MRELLGHKSAKSGAHWTGKWNQLRLGFRYFYRCSITKVGAEEWKGLLLVSWAFSLTLPFTLASWPLRALSSAIHQCDNAVSKLWRNVVVVATGCLIKLKRNRQIANCRLKGIWNLFVSATGCMHIIGHLVAPPSALSSPWHSSRSSNSNSNNISRNNNISSNNSNARCKPFSGLFRFCYLYQEVA